MEAATPLRKPQVSATGNHVTIHDLVVEDQVAARLVEESEDAAKTVTDAIEIGARVLDREQAAANAEYVRTEFEKTAKELDVAFTDKARVVAEHFGKKVDEVFDAESGQLHRDLEKLFSDGSASSVQNRVREVVAEALTKSQADLVRQFSSADDKNPLADFKAAIVRQQQQATAAQERMVERLGELQEQLVELRAEKEKLEELDAERERGTAKGRSFEEEVAEALDIIADAQGDLSEPVGDLKGATGKTGDVLVDIDACSGPSRGRIVFEAKNAKLSGPGAKQELADALRERDADYAVLVVPCEEKVPAKLKSLREIEGDKLVVTFDPEEGSRLALEVGYRLARARVLMKRADADGIDAGAVHDAAERALAALAEERRIKQQLTAAKTNIDNAYSLISELADRVRARLNEVDELVDAQVRLDV